jgi:hypothetical protein
VDHTVTATGSIVGIGNGDLQIVLTADALASCKNKGGNVPQGHVRTVSGTFTDTEVKNGHVDFTVTTGPVTAHCPGKMQPMVTFSNVTLKVFQNGAQVLQDGPVNL